MATSVTVTSVELPASGAVFVNFSDGTQLEFTNRAALISAVADVTNAEWCRTAIIARWYALNAALDDPTHINGKTFEVNLASPLTPFAIGVVP